MKFFVWKRELWNHQDTEMKMKQQKTLFILKSFRQNDNWQYKNKMTITEQVTHRRSNG